MSEVVSPHVGPFVKPGYILLGVPALDGRPVEFIGYSATVRYKDYEPYRFKSIMVCSYRHVLLGRDEIDADGVYVVGQEGTYFAVSGSEIDSELLDLTKGGVVTKVEVE